MGNVTDSFLNDDPTTVVMIGLPQAGKSSLLQYLVKKYSKEEGQQQEEQEQQLSSYWSGRGVMKEVEIMGIRFCKWDCGGVGFPVGALLALQQAKGFFFFFLKQK